MILIMLITLFPLSKTSLENGVFHCANDRPKSGAGKRARTVQNIAAVRKELTKNVLIRSPKKTSKRLAARLNVYKSSIRRIILSDLHLKPFKRKTVHYLTGVNKQRRLQRCTHLQEDMVSRKTKRIIFTDETVLRFWEY